jgi:hypothetical protein
MSKNIWGTWGGTTQPTCQRVGVCFRRSSLGFTDSRGRQPAHIRPKQMASTLQGYAIVALFLLSVFWVVVGWQFITIWALEL